MTQSDPQKPDPESKSQRKRDMLELQKLGESLFTLRDDQLAALNLPENLLAAIKLMKSLTSNEAKRRHLQYIGKLMRQVDTEEIKLVLKRIEFTHKKTTEQFHLVEEWRSKLLTQGDVAITTLLSEYPEIDRQQLRQLVRKGQQDIKNNKNTGAEKSLFQYLRSIFEKKK